MLSHAEASQMAPMIVRSAILQQLQLSPDLCLAGAGTSGRPLLAAGALDTS
jgi:hypothetical protein